MTLGDGRERPDERLVGEVHGRRIYEWRGRYCVEGETHYVPIDFLTVQSARLRDQAALLDEAASFIRGIAIGGPRIPEEDNQ